MKQIMKQIIKRIIIICIIVFGLVVVIDEVYSWTKFKDKTEDGPAPKITENDTKYLEEDGQSMQIDDYTVTLESYYYEKHIGNGHCLISIMQEGKKGKDIQCILDKHTDVSFITFGDESESKRYYMDFVYEPEGRRGTAYILSVKTSYKENKKYIYFDFYADTDGFNDKITIFDGVEEFKNENKNEGAISFELNDNTEWRNFTDGGDKIAVCHYGAEINDGEGKIIDFEICMKNGKKYSLKEGDMKKVYYENNGKIMQVRFNNSIDIDEIDSVKVE